MAAHKLLARLTRAGHTITVQDGMINVTPATSVTELRAHKQEILDLFTRQAHAMGEIKKHAYCDKTAKIDTPWGQVTMVPEKTGAGFEVTWDELANNPQDVLVRCQTVLLAETIFNGMAK